MNMIPEFKGPARQRGMVATLIAIIVLVATLLAVVGLLRSVDTGNLIAGTMSFRQGAMQEAERAYVAAKAIIPSCSADATDSGAYHAQLGTADTVHTDLPQLLTQQAVHATTASAGLARIAGASTGNDIYYVVERMCRTSGVSADSANCVLASASTGLATTSDETFLGGAGGGSGGVGAAKATYRLSVRVDGPKNVQAFVQTVFGRKSCI